MSALLLLVWLCSFQSLAVAAEPVGAPAVEPVGVPVATPAAVSAAGGAGGIDEVVSCVKANAPRQTMVQEAKLTTLDSSGADRVFEAKIYWKRDKKRLSRIYMGVEAPPDLRGAAFLMIERGDRAPDMWLYLPEIRKVRRISSRTISGSLFGTDFSYEDIKHLQLEIDGEATKRLPDTQLNGRAVYVVELEPAKELLSGYSRIVTYVDREYCVPLKMEFFEDSDVLRKLMTIDPAQVKKEANTWVPRHIVLRDLDRETESRFEVVEVEIDGKIPDRRFTQSQLARSR